jgi:hypothetical protein
MTLAAKHIAANALDARPKFLIAKFLNIVSAT